MNTELLTINPTKARLDVSTVCQLRCVLCPTEQNNGRAFLKSGTMSHFEFDRFLELNPQIEKVELASAGEALLNPELSAILKSACDRGVETSLGGGVNMNDVTEEVLEALVTCKTSRIRVSVDGVTEETYRQYRVGGSLNKVLENIKKLNEFKEKNHSEFPELVLQFIVFGHNEHEIERAFVLGRMMKMNVFIKLNRWPDRLAIRDRQKIRDLLGYADRSEFLESKKKQYCRDLCLGLWNCPQVNWDGRLRGCGFNTSITFAEYALGESFLREINNERMQYARNMLMGEASPRDDIPCSACPFYKQISEHNLWYTPEEIRSGKLADSVCRNL